MAKYSEVPLSTLKAFGFKKAKASDFFSSNT